MTTEQRVVAAYRERGPMTIGECKRATGLHSECIRPVVQRPRFRVVGFVWAGDRRVTLWALGEAKEELDLSTLTALDDGGTVHRADGADPWPGVCVAEASNV